jgi:hypothetical protein
MPYEPIITYKPISGTTFNIRAKITYSGINVIETIPVLSTGTNSNSLITAVEPYVGTSVNRYINGVLNNSGSPTVPTDTVIG